MTPGCLGAIRPAPGWHVPVWPAGGDPCSSVPSGWVEGEAARPGRVGGDRRALVACHVLPCPVQVTTQRLVPT